MFFLFISSKTGTTMIQIGEKGPTFKLEDHLGRTVDLQDLLGKGHVMLLFYPLDFTPT
ncbi:MAG TPA: redoxin domain-containing protein [Planctomycetes bacterium]|nr:redoxin domain-containing protein [Planctomycetota bacterium]